MQELKSENPRLMARLLEKYGFIDDPSEPIFDAPVFHAAAYVASAVGMKPKKDPTKVYFWKIQHYFNERDPDYPVNDFTITLDLGPWTYFEKILQVLEEQKIDPMNYGELKKQLRIISNLLTMFDNQLKEAFRLRLPAPMSLIKLKELFKHEETQNSYPIWGKIVNEYLQNLNLADQYAPHNAVMEMLGHKYSLLKKYADKTPAKVTITEAITARNKALDDLTAEVKKNEQQIRTEMGKSKRQLRQEREQQEKPS